MDKFGTFVVQQWPLFLALLVIAILLVRSFMRGKLGGFEEIPPADVVRLMNREDALMVDVRETNEFRKGHILHAKHIPLAALKTRIGELAKHRERPIIVSCRTGARSATAAAMLHKAGFKSLYNLRGGMLAWENDHLPLTKE